MAGTPSKNRKRTASKKQVARGNPQKPTQSRDPRHVEKATARDWIGGGIL